MTALAGGFAAAVVPVSAETITTDDKDLIAGEVKIKVSDGEMPAYRAMPKIGKNLPTVLVAPEIVGVHEHIKDVCRRFAKSDSGTWRWPLSPSSQRVRPRSLRAGM